MNPFIPLKTIIQPFLVTLVLACLALPPASRALLPPPPPDGGYPGFNTAEGTFALYSRTTGSFNSAVGYLALFENTSGSSNTASGFTALFGNMTGENNTAIGAKALQTNTEGSNNVAVGFQALFSNTAGFNNTATGVNALFNNSTVNGAPGIENTANGFNALFSNTRGGHNTAIGVNALYSNTDQDFNTAIGHSALLNNVGTENTAVGANTLSDNQHGIENTAMGYRALIHNDGDRNTAIGDAALFNNSTGFGNTAVGPQAGFNVTTASNVICIGNAIGGANVSNSCFIGSIFGQTASGGTAVFINSAGKLGTTTSSRRFKEEIKPMDHFSEALFSLKPVTFRYKKEIDSAGTSQFGLVAEDVEKVNPELVVRDTEGKPYTVRYDQVNAMLLNEFLKEHRKNEEQGATITRLEKQIEALIAGLQKVRAQVEAGKPTAQVAVKD